MDLSVKSGGSIAGLRGKIQALSSFAVYGAVSLAGDQKGCT
jgi:hypothetical protein